MNPRLHQALKLSPLQHTGKRLPREATSHGVLVALLLFVGVVLSVVTKVVLVSAASPGNGSLTLSGAVPGKAPRVAAVITRPTDGQIFTQQQISLAGTCPNASFVQVFKNGIYGGSAICSSGSFELNIDLLNGRNDLTVKVYDSLGQFGPDSATVTVYYETVAGYYSQTSPQLLITTESYYHGIPAGQQFTLNVTIVGGQSPYAVVIKWGDGLQSVFARQSSGQFPAGHIYRDGGIYKALIEATDSKGHSAGLQHVILVNGPLKAPPVTGHLEPSPPEVPPSFVLIWPLYLICLAIILVFWLGERYELHKLKHANHILQG